jgi:hypothetical protein
MRISPSRLFASAAVIAAAVAWSGCYRYYHPRFIEATGQAILSLDGPIPVYDAGPPPMPDNPPPAPFEYPVVRAEGFGVPNPGMNPAQGKLMARRAAISDARRNLLEQIKGAQLSSETYVRDFITQYDEINSQVNGLVAGAQVVDEEEQPDGTVRVAMEANLADISPYIDRYRPTDAASSPPPAAPVFPDMPTGFAGVPGPDHGYVKARLMATRGATIVARRNLLDVIMGTRFNGRRLYGDWMRENPEIRARIEGIVGGAPVVEGPVELAGGVIEMTVRVDMQKVRRAIYR